MGGIASLVPAADTALAIAALERLVVDLAARRNLWREHVHHAPDQRLYTQLYREPHLDIWSSAGTPAKKSACTTTTARQAGGVPATSIQAYSPALWRMGYYSLGPRGLGRTSLTYLEEVEPAA